MYEKCLDNFIVVSPSAQGKVETTCGDRVLLYLVVAVAKKTKTCASMSPEGTLIRQAMSEVLVNQFGYVFVSKKKKKNGGIFYKKMTKSGTMNTIRKYCRKAVANQHA